MSEIEPVRRPQAIEPCEECGAPMDPQQRYCVNCAARRGNGANPSSRYFATMSKRSRRPLTGPPPKQSPTSRAAAVAFFALLPLAVGLGLVIGRSGSGNDNSDALLQALRERPAATAGTLATTGSAATAKKAKKDAKAAKGKGKGTDKVVAHTENGDVHEVANFAASKQKEEEDTQIVAENPEQTGDDYIKAQQNLPDVIVVGGEGGGSAPAPSGSEP
jgi:hypothetical protein